MEASFIAKHVRALWDARELTDTVVVVGGTELHVHRVCKSASDRLACLRVLLLRVKRLGTRGPPTPPTRPRPLRSASWRKPATLGRC